MLMLHHMFDCDTCFSQYGPTSPKIENLMEWAKNDGWVFLDNGDMFCSTCITPTTKGTT